MAAPPALVAKKITQFSRPKLFDPDKCPAYLRVTYTGKAALTLEQNVRIAVENCYGSMTIWTVFGPIQCCQQVGKIFYLPFKRVPSSMSISATVTVGVGRASQRLRDRIKRHVLKWLRQHTGSLRVQPDRACKQNQPTPKCDSAIGQHHR